MTTIIIIVVLLACWMCRERIGNLFAGAVATLSEVEPEVEQSVTGAEAEALFNEDVKSVSSEDAIPNSTIARPETLPPVTFLGMIWNFIKFNIKMVGYIIVFLVVVYVLINFVGLDV